MSTTWTTVSPELRNQVLDHLTREAERLEQDADRLLVASRTLGRPSLTEGQMQAAEAFRAAISLLAAGG